MRPSSKGSRAWPARLWRGRSWGMSSDWSGPPCCSSTPCPPRSCLPGSSSGTTSHVGA
ncbi:unnamed protein product [Symbiodinium sp. CCMP2456]|nr:unnamed protein product [Symbiodinium sp. CCMP2456]